MKTGCRIPLLVPLIVLAAFLSACSTTKVDWNSRIGIYTYDQALVDLGPPDKAADLSGGGKVAEWLTRRSSSGVAVGAYYGAGYYHRSYYGFAPYYYAPSSWDSYLRLTFGPDGKLQAWKKFSR